MDRVEQNLLRLSDIVEEVERRLKSLRNQATKARRYREYSERLKELRTYVGLVDYRGISSQCDELDAQLASIGSEVARHQAIDEDAERAFADLSKRMSQLSDHGRQLRQQSAKLRESIVSRESSSRLQRQTLTDLEQEEATCRRKLIAVRCRAGATQQQLSEMEDELSQLENDCAEARSKALSEDQGLRKVNAELETIAKKSQALKDKQEHQRNATTSLRTILANVDSELNLAENAIQRDTGREKQLQQQLRGAETKADESATKESKLKSALDEATKSQSKVDQRWQEASRQLDTVNDELNSCRNQLAATRERTNVLEEVERRLEGIGSGTQHLLEQAKSNPIAFAEVQGNGCRLGRSKSRNGAAH